MTPEQLRISTLKAAINGKLTPNEVSEDSDLPIGWSNTKIGKIASVVVGATPSTSNSNYWENGNIPWIPSGSCQNCDVESAPKFITQLGYDSCCTKLMPPDTVLIALTGATAGKVGYLKIEACGNQSVVGILPSDAMDQKYIYYYLMAERDTILSDCVGSAQPHISKAYIVDMDMNVPPLEEQHRIVSKIEELLPYIDRYAEAYEKLEKFNAKFPEDMKKSILQYAIQGKLVEQRPEEGTAEELYRQIQEDREKRIKCGEIKKDKRATLEGVEVEKPFDIPDSWKWVTLGSILLKLTDGTHKTPKYTEEGIKFVSVKDMSSGILSLENTKFISIEEHKELFLRCDPQRGDMLLSKVGTTGVPAIIDTDEEFSLFVSVALLKYNHSFINEKFLYYLLQSPLVQLQATENTRGVGNKNWVLDAIAKTLIVLPPYEEQHRIVAELDRLLPYCDRLKE